jgi:ligand-binding SRPBCC domain-containing protein
VSTRFRTFERTSVVEAPREAVWARIVTPRGINDEMMPLLRMAMPRGRRGLTVDTVEVGRKVGRCRLYLFGIVPFDHDDLMLAELEPGHRFLERSTMASMRTWEHERTLTADGARRTLVHDRVRFEPRGPIAAVPGLPGLLERVIGRFFAHRHRKLRRHFAS